MKLLFASANPAQVGLIRSLLDSGKVVYELRNQGISQAIPGVSFEMEIWVSDEDFPRAKELLDSAQP